MWSRVDIRERERCELIEAIADGVASVKGSADRVGNLWTLKLMAENIARLDELDRKEGFLPVEIRPPLMMSWDEAVLAVRALRADVRDKDGESRTKAVSLVKKLNGYLSKTDR
jgi:hypothetical protein